MKKSFSKSLKLEIKPVFQFSATETKGQNDTDPTISTVTATTYIFQQPNQK
jgi:hypothetical protein